MVKPSEDQVRTMEEFSAYVGLSRPTVSKYFNDPSVLRPKTRQRIEAAVARSGFRPNILASNLVRRRSNIIGLVVPDPVDPFYAALTRRVQAIADISGLHAFVLSSDGNPAAEARAIETLASMNVAGAIVAPLGTGAGPALERFEAAIPLVYVDSSPAEPRPFVGTDNNRSFRLIVDHLVETGSAPRFLGMPQVNANAGDRAHAYTGAMKARGEEPVFVPLPDWSGWDFERFGFEAMARVAETGDVDGTTILCANDRLAFGAVAAAFQAGLRVGREPGCHLRIAGHDDHPLSRYTCPPLTTVAQDYDEIGRLATEMLLARIAGDETEPSDADVPSVLLGGRVVPRSSA